MQPLTFSNIKRANKIKRILVKQNQVCTQVPTNNKPAEIVCLWHYGERDYPPAIARWLELEI